MVHQKHPETIPKNQASVGELFNSASLGVRMVCRAVPAATTSPGIYGGNEDDVSGIFHGILNELSIQNEVLHSEIEQSAGWKIKKFGKSW